MSVKSIIHKQNKTALSGRKWSPAIWSDCPVLQIMDGTVDGFFFQDRFGGLGDVGTVTSVLNVGPYEIMGDAGTGAGAVDVLGGGYVLTVGTTTNDDITMAYGGGAPLLISDTAGSDWKLWFEAQFKVSTITTDVFSIFVGLAEEDRTAAAGLFADEDNATLASALASIDMLGFFVQSQDGDGLNFGYRKAGATPSEAISDVLTLAADTFVNVGFVYDPKAPAAKRIRVIANNQENATYITADNIAASTFPDGEEMTMVFGAVNSDGSTAAKLTMRGLRVAQVYE